VNLRGTASVLLALVASAWLDACEGQGPSVRPAEPIQVLGGQFMAGPLPASPPAAGSPPATHLAVTQVSAPVLPLVAGAVNQSISGLATSDAVSVGLALGELGTGYWVVPLGAPDPLYPGQLTFAMTANFNPADSPGPHLLRLAAIDSAGHGGPETDTPICISSAVPDNGHACDASKNPPAAVISLRWDVGFDLDLNVVLPDGTIVGPKSPVGTLGDAGAPSRIFNPQAPSLPIEFDRDSWGGCAPDGFFQEDLVLQAPPAHGTYHVYANPFAPCGQSVVHFTLTVYTLTGTCPDCRLASSSPPTSGELLSSQATGGASSGLFIYDQGF
jgi:hypothetical protein